jgi:WD40 repeat protein
VLPLIHPIAFHSSDPLLVGYDEVTKTLCHSHYLDDHPPTYHNIVCDSDPTCFAFSPESQKFAILGRSESVLSCHMISMVEMRTLWCHSLLDSVGAIDTSALASDLLSIPERCGFLLNGAVLCCSTGSNIIQILDSNSSEVRCQTPGQGAVLISVDTLNTQSLIASGSLDGTIHLWKLEEA